MLPNPRRGLRTLRADSATRTRLTDRAFMQFLQSRRPDLRRIAAHTRGEHTMDDVIGEVWLTARQIGDKRGLDIDFAEPDDQELVLSWVYRQLVSWADKSVRFAVKLDRDWDTEDAEYAAHALARLLTAPEHFDPVMFLLAEEDRAAPLRLAQHSYSQASAWLILLHRFDWALDALASNLRLIDDTVRRRIVASGQHMRVQPSLFDRIQRIAEDFEPLKAKGLLRTTEHTDARGATMDLFD